MIAKVKGTEQMEFTLQSWKCVSVLQVQGSQPSQEEEPCQDCLRRQAQVARQHEQISQVDRDGAQARPNPHQVNEFTVPSAYSDNSVIVSNKLLTMSLYLLIFIIQGDTSG